MGKDAKARKRMVAKKEGEEDAKGCRKRVEEREGGREGGKGRRAKFDLPSLGSPSSPRPIFD